MHVYEQELQKLMSLRDRMAQFRRVAIHCHTPLSYDWAQDCGDRSLNDRKKYLPPGKEAAFLQEVTARTDPSLDLIIPTDHMMCDYAARLATAAPARGLVVIPGMEVSLRTSAAMGDVRVHVLVLLPAGSAKESFSRLLPDLPEERNRSGKEELNGRE